MKKKKNFILRIYRIKESHDKVVKKNAKKHGGESAYIRSLLAQAELQRE